MPESRKKIMIINLMKKDSVREESILANGTSFATIEHNIGWDFKVAESIIRTYDGWVDGFALVGIPKHLGVSKDRIHYPGYVRLLRAATKTSVYVADDLRDLFSDWTLKRVLSEQPQLFHRKKVLFQCASVTSVLPEIIASGGNVYAADPLLISGLPILLRGTLQMSCFFNLVKPIINPLIFKWVDPLNFKDHSRIAQLLRDWINHCDIFVGFGAMLGPIGAFDILSGKQVIVDHVNPETRKRLEAAGVVQIIEYIPDRSSLTIPEVKSFPVLAAVIDQTRIAEKSDLNFSDYLLQWIEEAQLRQSASRRA